jgi:CBS domain-containing protein
MKAAIVHPSDRPRRTSEPATVDGFARRPWAAIGVDQVMRAPVLTCGAETPLRDLARLMVTHAIHAVVVVDREENEDDLVTGIVTDLAIARAAVEGREPVARDLAEAGAPAVSVGWTLEQATREMLRTGSAHVVVIDGRGTPIGMLSTMDLARLLASDDDVHLPTMSAAVS